MGLRDALSILRTTDQVGEYVRDPAMIPYATPWSPGELAPIIVDDVWGTSDVLGRRQAMRIPAVARARNLLVSTGCRIPMRAMTADDQIRDDAQFLVRTGTATSWQLRNAWTMDDLMFYGWSLWVRNNRQDGFPVAADRVDIESWTVNDDHRVEVNGRVMSDEEIILIPGLHEGILELGMDAINDTRELYRTVRERIENPIPAIDLHQTGGEALNAQQRKELIDQWIRARKAKGGAAVGYTSETIEARELGRGLGNDLLIEARNAAALDLARLVGVSAGRIDATAPKSSLNYETTQGRNQEFVEFDLALYLTPITARLSLDDCVPSGSRVVHDFEDFVGLAPSLTGPTLED